MNRRGFLLALPAIAAGVLWPEGAKASTSTERTLSPFPQPAMAWLSHQDGRIYSTPTRGFGSWVLVPGNSIR